jgi:dihydropteroate synthase type 2
VNLSGDSFSAGGRHRDPDAAIAHARTLVRDGADAIDLGAAASNPDAVAVSADEEIRRLTPVVDALARDGVAISIDSFQPAVQAWASSRHVEFLNDTRGFPDRAHHPRLANGASRLVVMHAVQQKGRADRTVGDATTIYDRVVAFFRGRLAELEAGGIPRTRCILDPGMGFFLGAGVEPSLVVLRRLPELRAAFELPVLVSVSRKSFLGGLTGRPSDERGAATLAAELFAVRQGVDWIRTHDVRALRDALVVAQALEGGR